MVNNFQFGDTSDSKQNLDETLMESKLNSLNLVRKSIPKDGSCLFRAICSAYFGNQNYHFLCTKQNPIQSLFDF